MTNENAEASPQTFEQELLDYLTVPEVGAVIEYLRSVAASCTTGGDVIEGLAKNLEKACDDKRMAELADARTVQHHRYSQT